jgi:hypothetical protein
VGTFVVGGSLSWADDRLVLLRQHLTKLAANVTTTPWPDAGGGRTMGVRQLPPVA